MPASRQDSGGRPHFGWWGRLGWTLVSAFLICWAFVLGVLVGQGSLATPEQLAKLQKFLTSLPLVQGLWEEKPPPKDHKLKPPELSFYRGLEGEHPGEEKGKGKSPSSAPVRSSTPKKGSYTVQVASFKDEAQALGLVRQLKGAGQDAYLLRSEVEGVGLRFRVRVGPFMTLEEAQGSASRIREQHKLAAYVTRGE
jgi:hypothetical protein